MHECDSSKIILGNITLSNLCRTGCDSHCTVGGMSSCFNLKDIVLNTRQELSELNDAANALNALQNMLQIAKTHLISNAIVKEAKPEYRERNDKLHWTITSRTTIQEFNENHDGLLESAYNFTTFAELQPHMDKLTDINILAVIIDIRPKQKIQSKCGGDSTIQEMILLNKGFQTLTLTMWDAFVFNECKTTASTIHRKPIVAGLRLRVVSHDGNINVRTNLLLAS